MIAILTTHKHWDHGGGNRYFKEVEIPETSETSSNFSPEKTDKSSISLSLEMYDELWRERTPTSTVSGKSLRRGVDTDSSSSSDDSDLDDLTAKN